MFLFYFKAAKADTASALSLNTQDVELRWLEKKNLSDVGVKCDVKYFKLSACGYFSCDGMWYFKLRVFIPSPKANQIKPESQM